MMRIPCPAELRTWYRKTVRHEQRMREGKLSGPPALPKPQNVFTNENFLKFAGLYLRVSYKLGAFEELNSINFQLVRENMFTEDDAHDEMKEEDVYEDEEVELSDDEDSTKKKLEVEIEKKEETFMTRLIRWILSTFNCSKYKSE